MNTTPFTIESMLTSANLRALAVRVSTEFHEQARPYLGGGRACGVFEGYLRLGHSQRALKVALEEERQWVEVWINRLNELANNPDPLVKESASRTLVKGAQRPSRHALRKATEEGHCPFLYDEGDDEGDDGDHHQTRQNQYRFLFDGHWYNSEGGMVIPDLGFMVDTDDFEEHSRQMSEKYQGCPVVLFYRSDEWEGCWEGNSYPTHITEGHSYQMCVPLFEGKLVWGAWSFAPMWEGATVINLSLIGEGDTDEPEEWAVAVPFRGKVLKGAKQAIRSGKKIKLAA